MAIPASWAEFVVTIRNSPNDYRVSKVCTRARGSDLEVCVLVEHRPAPGRIPVERFCIHFGRVVLPPNTVAGFAYGYDIQTAIQAPSQLAPNAVSRCFEDRNGARHEFISVAAPRLEACTDCCS